MDDLTSKLFQTVCGEGYVDVKLLLDSGADKDGVNEDGETPLYVAIKHGHNTGVKLLLEAGADINKANYENWVPLDIAVFEGNSAYVKLLLDAGADKDRARNNFGDTPLSTAISYGYDRIVKLLLDSGANIFRQNHYGMTPLHIAAELYPRRIICVKLLLEAGADINKANNFGKTPLHAAARTNNNTCVELLIERGADINKTNNDGWTPLMIAVQYGCVECGKLLLDATYNDIADKVLVAVSQQDIIFDTTFIIFKKTLENTIRINGFDIDDPDTHKKLYNVFQAKSSKYTKK